MVRAVGLFSRKQRPDLDEIPPEAAAIVEQLTEMFPEATVTVNEPVEVDLGGRPSDDRISQLERLAKLRDQGALTDSEFQAEKARILGEG